MVKRIRVGGRPMASVFFFVNGALVLFGTIGACASARAFEIDSEAIFVGNLSPPTLASKVSIEVYEFL